jgi:hypothetical protein
VDSKRTNRESEVLKMKVKAEGEILKQIRFNRLDISGKG